MIELGTLAIIIRIYERCEVCHVRVLQWRKRVQLRSYRQGRALTKGLVPWFVRGREQPSGMSRSRVGPPYYACRAGLGRLVKRCASRAQGPKRREGRSRGNYG